MWKDYLIRAINGFVYDYGIGDLVKQPINYLLEQFHSMTEYIILP